MLNVKSLARIQDFAKERRLSKIRNQKLQLKKNKKKTYVYMILKSKKSPVAEQFLYFFAQKK